MLITPDPFDSETRQRIEQIRVDLEMKGFTVHIQQGEFGRGQEMNVYAIASKIIPDPVSTVAIGGGTVEIERKELASEIDFAKHFLQHIFPYLTAPAFQPKYTTRKEEVFVAKTEITKTQRIYVKHNSVLEDKPIEAEDDPLFKAYPNPDRIPPWG